MSSAEALAQEFEEGEEVGTKSTGKRSKAEQAEHKHAHPGDNTRKIVDNALHGEEKRKAQNQAKNSD